MVVVLWLAGDGHNLLTISYGVGLVNHLFLCLFHELGTSAQMIGLLPNVALLWVGGLGSLSFMVVNFFLFLFIGLMIFLNHP